MNIEARWMAMVIKVSFFLFVTVVACAAAFDYPGHLGYYIVFSVVANCLLINGFKRRAIFFDTFIGIFLWLGFWLKFSLRMALDQASFPGALAFDGSSEALDHALIVSSCGLAALLFASIIRRGFFNYPSVSHTCEASGLFRLYQRYRIYCVSFFLILVLAFAISNALLGIYQRGMVAQTTLPYGLSGIYKWMLQFGLASFSAVIIRFEIELSRNITFMAFVPALFESFLSNVSLLSRGMVLNAAALAIGSAKQLLLMKVRVNIWRVAACSIAFVVLFAISVLSVNFLRAWSYEEAAAVSSLPASLGATVSSQSAPSGDTIRNMTVPLFLERWIGIEAVVAVSSSNELGWDLWREAWQERFREGELSIYDQRFVDTPYVSNPDTSKFHFVSLPGIIAFLYFPGSLPFLFLATATFGLIGSVIEIAAYKYAGANLILCSLIAQVVAYRYAHFGYVPAQSYLLIGAILLNITFLFFADWFLRKLFKL